VLKSCVCSLTELHPPWHKICSTILPPISVFIRGCPPSVWKYGCVRVCWVCVCMSVRVCCVRVCEYVRASVCHVWGCAWRGVRVYVRTASLPLDLFPSSPSSPPPSPLLFSTLVFSPPLLLSSPVSLLSSPLPSSPLLSLLSSLLLLSSPPLTACGVLRSAVSRRSDSTLKNSCTSC